MSSLRKLDRIRANLDKPVRRGRDVGVIIELYNNYADVRLGNSPSIVKNVQIQGNSEDLYVGKKVKIEWGERDGTVGLAPYITGGASEYISGTGGVSTVTVDNITIENPPSGLTVKRGGLGIQHLNFLPAVDGHTHKTPLELGGWQFTPDGIMYTDYMFIHPLGQMRVGRNNDVIMLDSVDTTYRLWAGHAAPASAPFSVTKAGAIKATSGEIAGWTIDTSKIAGGGIEMYSAGYIQSTPFTSGLVGFRIDDDVAEFNNVRVRGELHSAVFVYDELHATSGTFGVFPSAGVLLNDATVSGTFNVDIKDPDTGHAQLFSSGDRLRIKDGSGNDTWLAVTSALDQTTFWRYTCVYLAGTNSVTYRAGATVIDYGSSSGDGYITMSADGAVGASPNITLATHAGSPQTTQTIIGRMGNLNGSYGEVTNVYGFAFGNYATDQYIKWDNNGGVLTISGTVNIGQGFGFSTPATIHLPFDGPGTLRETFDVSTVGHLGQVPTVRNAASAWFGKWHKAARFGYGRDNKIANPRFEINTTGWTFSGTGGSIARSTTRSFIGTASLGVTAGSATIIAGQSTPYSLSNTVGIHIQARVFNPGATAANSYIRIRDTSNNATRASAYATKVGEWELLDCHWTNNTGSAVNIDLQCINTYADSSTVVYFDAVMLEIDSSNEYYMTPYFDGDFPGAYWTSTEHGSTSVSNPVDMYWEGITFPEINGSVSMWFQCTLDMDETLSTTQYLTYYGSTSGMTIYISTSEYLYGYIAGSGISYQLNGTNFKEHVWHHIAYTWDKTAGESKLYLDGVQVGSTGGYNTFNPTTQKLYVGNVGTAVNVFGYIDDYALIPRTLTPQEVAQIYYSDTPLNVSGRNFGLHLAEAGVGRILGDAAGIKGYDNDETALWEIGAEGIKLYAHALPGSAPDSDINFYNSAGTTKIGALQSGYYSTETTWIQLYVDEATSASSAGTYIDLEALSSGNATDGAWLSIWSGVTANAGYVSMKIDQDERFRVAHTYTYVYNALDVAGNAQVDGGIGVGTHTPAGAGTIRASSYILTLNHMYLQHNSTPTIYFGASNDTNIYRYDANILKTDDAFAVAGNFYCHTGLFMGSGSIGPTYPYKIAPSAPVAVTGFGGDSYSTAAKAFMDMSSLTGLTTSYVKHWHLQVYVRDSGSDSTSARGICLWNSSTADVGIFSMCTGVLNDAIQRYSVIVPADANGDIYIQKYASGSSTLDIWIQVIGYFIG